MKTILKSKNLSVTFGSDFPFAIIGEKINPTGRKKLGMALNEKNFDYIRELAVKQVAAGADILDVNVGAPGIDEVDLLPEVVKLVEEAVDVPICIDSANKDALAAALKIVTGKALVNSVNGEEASLERVLPLVKEHGAAVIGLAIDENGIPKEADTRFRIVAKIIERASKMGIPLEDIVIDPLVLTVGSDSNAGAVTLKTIELVKNEFGVNINLGASNVSFGMPDRHMLNQAFLAMAIQVGATCAITDPIKLTSIIRSADLIKGTDKNGMRYLKYWRKQQK
jgi:5-methyltetrahydrofolate--homocysteine methyltransferase